MVVAGPERSGKRLINTTRRGQPPRPGLWLHRQTDEPQNGETGG